jgi:glycosyltransferase involved in cell wall biosynthesis
MSKVSVIVPTLNEAGYLGDLLSSLERQDYRDFETIVVDGGSSDRTLTIADAYGARTLVIPGGKEFPSRNAGAALACGQILLFTGADVVFPDNLLGEVVRKFQQPDVLAVAGPGIPADASPVLSLEFAIYNSLRWLFARLPRPLKAFSTSTNLLAVRKSTFEELGGFPPNDVNADGAFGRALCRHGRVVFCFSSVRAFQSSRRMRKMGAVKFNAHFAYVLENFFPFLSATGLMRRLKHESGQSHSVMRKEAYSGR